MPTAPPVSALFVMVLLPLSALRAQPHTRQLVSQGRSLRVTRQVTAYVASRAISPPEQSEWHEACGSWVRVVVAVAEQLSPTNCGAMASLSLASASCASLQAGAASDCQLPCAESVLAGAQRCQAAGRQTAAAFAAAAGAAADRCTATVSAALSSLPPVVTVAGLQCETERNTAYQLQPIPLNGRGHWETSDGLHHLYWTPSDSVTTRPTWILDSDTGAERLALACASRWPIAGVAWRGGRSDCCDRRRDFRQHRRRPAALWWGRPTDRFRAVGRSPVGTVQRHLHQCPAGADWQRLRRRLVCLHAGRSVAGTGHGLLQGASRRQL